MARVRVSDADLFVLSEAMFDAEDAYDASPSTETLRAYLIAKEANRKALHNNFHIDRYGIWQ